MTPGKSLFAGQLRYWRQVQGLSQLSLSALAGTTARHVSFLEGGRSRPTEAMVHRLADALEVPIRERNSLLESAGFAGSYPVGEASEASLAPFLEAIRYTLRSHAPYPAIAKNRHYEVVDLNEPARRLFTLVDPQGLSGNVLEWMLGENPRLREVFENYESVAWSMIYRVRGEAARAPHDERLAELAQFAEGRAKQLAPSGPVQDYVVCPTLRLEGQRVSMMGMTAHFGTPREATLDELRVELMFPRDAETAEFFERLAEMPALRLASAADVP